MLFGKNINRYYLKYWYFLLGGIVALFFVDYIGQVRPPQIIGGIIDNLDNGTMTTELLLDYALQLLEIMLIVFFGRFTWRMCFFGAGYRVAADLRHRLFQKSLTLSQTFYSDHKVGGLMSYYINDVQSVRETFAWGTMMLCDVLFLVPIVTIEMFRTNWVIALITMFPLAIICVLGLVVGKYMEKKYKTRQDRFEDLSDFTQESISGIRVIKAFVREAKELQGFAKKNKENLDANIDYLKLSILFNVLIDAFIWSIYLVILAIGSYLVMNTGVITIGELTMLASYFDILIWPMFAIGEFVNIRSRGKASLTRLDIILDAKNDLIERDNPITLEGFKGNITFKNLTFRYPDANDINALSDINFEIKAGEFIGIIGRTGTSKTTLVNLLLRLYNVPYGEIFLDETDIMDLKIRDVRDQIGYVPQDNFLYSDTIESNIAFSSNRVDSERVRRQAMIAGVHKDIVEFPKGYETILGERGVSVSGGQKQRISIARALYKEPAVLILDDSLSAVDTKTEADILDYLKKERHGKTTILIAHRISSIKDADKILVLDSGQVSGFDTHENLIKTNAIYKEIYSLQRLDEEGGIDHE